MSKKEEISAERRAKVRAEVEGRVKAEQNAHQFVEKLSLCEKVSIQEFKEILNQMMINHYQDVAEERSISLVCGYPICSNKLKKVAKQKFHISTQSNKVFNISERKRFCNVQCFKASKHVEKQILQTPLWLRDNSTIGNIRLLNEESVVHMKECEKEINFNCTVDLMGNLSLSEKLTSQERSELKISEGSEEVTQGQSEEEKNEQIDRFKEFEREYRTENLISEDSITDHQNANIEPIPNKNNIEITRKDNTNNRSFTNTPLPNKHGSSTAQKKTIKIIEPEFLQSPSSSTNSQQPGENPEELFNQVTRCISEWLANSESHAFLSFGNVQPSVVQANKLLGHRLFEEKVMKFLARSPEWRSECTVLDKQNVLLQGYTVPKTDSKSQMAIRRKIVKDKLAICIKKLLPILELSIHEYKESGMLDFVDTLVMTSQNIVLKPIQWSMATLTLLKLITNEQSNLYDVLSSRRQHISDYAINTLNIDVNLIDTFVNNMTKNTNV